MFSELFYEPVADMNIGTTKNSAPRMVAPAGSGSGLIVDDKPERLGIVGDLETAITGRMSTGILVAAVAGMVFFYIWTRNVQGGG